MKHHDKPRLTSGIWERALERATQLAESLIRRAVRALGAGIASAVNLLDPEVVILGGGMGVRLGPRLMPQIEDHAAEHLLHRPPAADQGCRARRPRRRDRRLFCS